MLFVLVFASDVSQTADVSRVGAIPQPVGKLDHGFLSHAIEQVICLGVEQNGGTHAIRPEVIMGDAPQTGLDASQHNRLCSLEVTTDQVRVDDNSSVGTAIIVAAGSVVIVWYADP